MSRLEKFIIENINVNGVSFKERDVEDFLEFWVDIEKNCKPFLKELKKNNPTQALLLRGEQQRGKFITTTPRTDRRPKDTPYEWHVTFDEYFNNEFGWNARSEGLFCTGRYDTASGYGDSVYIIFPIGRYKYIWSENISDLYTKIEDGGYEYMGPDDELMDQWQNEYDDEYIEGGGNGGWYYDGVDYGLNYDDQEDAIKSILDVITNDIQYEKNDLEDILDRNDKDEMEEYGSSKSGTGKEYIEDRISEIDSDIDDTRNNITNKIEWEPDINFDQYMEERKENIENENISDYMYYNAVERICEGEYYSNVKLIDALVQKNGPEIMVKCKKYYAIRNDYKELILHALLKGAIDPRQMSFDFGSKRRK
ncbi:MAG: hypothetical protein KQ78_01999 [Candidatus Izimaplasma bacterium HR2]|nr:MAG: hypothetical protein KQ78_01999 [Candidatus Izimaplasma bacterium HR2]